MSVLNSKQIKVSIEQIEIGNVMLKSSRKIQVRSARTDRFMEEWMGTVPLVPIDRG
jgi:hypothetical protein